MSEYCKNCFELAEKLAKKEQECEALKSEAFTRESLITEQENEIDELRQECEELIEENQKLEMQLCNDCGERDDYNIPCKMIRDLDYVLQKEIEDNNRYRKALEEIEEIADVLITETNEYESCYYKNSCGDNCYPRIAKVSEHSLGRQTYCQYEAVAKILDIINKARG